MQIYIMQENTVAVLYIKEKNKFTCLTEKVIGRCGQHGLFSQLESEVRDWVALKVAKNTSWC